MPKYFIINTEAFSKGEIPEELVRFRKKAGRTFTILDESSKIKTNNPCKESKKSKRTQAIKKVSYFGDRCILTGTFMTKNPVNIYDQVEFLYPNFFKEGMFAFAEHYTIRMTLESVRGQRILISEKVWKELHKRFHNAYQKKGNEGLQAAYASAYNYSHISCEDCNLIFMSEEYKPFKNLRELYDRIKDFTMIVRKEDCLDLPPKLYRTIRVPITDEQLQLYKELVNSSMTEDCIVTNPLTLFHRLQDVVNGYRPIDLPEDENGKIKVRLEPINSVKMEALLETLEEINLEEKQVIVWCARTTFLKDIVAKLTEQGISCVRYDGKISDEEKDKAKKDFESGIARVFVANQASGGYGLDCLKNAQYAIYVCNDFSVETRVQSEDRIHRGKADGYNRTIIDIVTQGTVDERVTDNLLLGKELLGSGKTDKAIFDYKKV